MSREGLPTRLISAAPPRVLDLSTSLWRLLMFEVPAVDTRRPRREYYATDNAAVVR